MINQKNERRYYGGESCVDMLSKDLREQAMKKVNYQKKRNDTVY